MDATPQDVSDPSTPFPFQSKELNWVIELIWEDWCWFMFLCSDSTNFFLLSHFLRDKTLLLSCKAFLGQTVHEAIGVFLFAGLWQGHHSCQGTPHALCVHAKVQQHCPCFRQCPQWHKPFLSGSLANEQHISISSPWLPSHGVCSGCGSHVIAAMPACNYPNQAC